VEVLPRRRPHESLRSNGAWQRLNILAHNVDGNFQVDTPAAAKPRSRKRTYAYLLRSMLTLRFLLIARTGRLTCINAATLCSRLEPDHLAALRERLVNVR
jgi:hypothetical protein